jgi:hypothetical protein
VKAFIRLSFVGFVVCALQLGADTLRMRDGRMISGALLAANNTAVRFQRDDGSTDRYNVGDIESIWFGSTNAERGYNDRGRDDDRPARSNDPDRYNNQDRYNSQDRPNDQARYNDQGRPRDGSADRYTYNGDTQPSGNINSSSDGILPAGTVFSVRTIDPIESDATHTGDTYHASLSEPVIVNGRAIAPVGSDAMIQVVRIQQGGRITGREDVTLALASFTDADGRVFDLNTSNEDISSRSRGQQSAGVIGGGAVIGAIIGAVVGGGAGAAIGAGAGAALGAGAQLLRGQHVKVTPETLLSFTLTHDLNLR